MKSWDYIGYAKLNDQDDRRFYWSNGESIAYKNYEEPESNMLPEHATIKCDMVRDRYDGNLAAFMNDWNIIPNIL